MVLDLITGTVKTSLGSDLFYLPHMLTVDQEGNLWVTDVGLHQVLKMRPDGTVVFTLGTKVSQKKKHAICEFAFGKLAAIDLERISRL